MLLLKSCHCCGLVQSVPSGAQAICARCATRLGAWWSSRDGNAFSAALALAALLLYLPAMWLPFLRIERLGHAHASSLVGGVLALLSEGQVLVGLVVLAFSIVLPICKLTALLALSQRRWRLPERSRAMVYRWVEHLGRWGMLDVLLVAVMVAFVKLGGLVQFTPGPGLVLFVLFVLLSLGASAVFDPYALWDEGLHLAQATVSNESSSAAGVPSADVAIESVPSALPPPPSRSWWIWLIPVAALSAGGVMLWNVWSQVGGLVVVEFTDGHGLAAGADLRYHGIVCGQVEQVQLTPDLRQVEVTVRLTRAADGLAREGARFWIVRPQADLTGIAGLETVVGAKYLTLLPGSSNAPRAERFQGLDEPPVPDMEEPGGLEIVLQSAQGSGLRAGLGVYYRDIRIGGVTATHLAADGSVIETRAYIRPAYRHLVRDNSVFWNASGLHLHGGLTEFSLHVGSAETLLRGGVALSLPPEPGAMATSGQRFLLHPRPQSEWLEWKPSIAGKQPDPTWNLPRLQPAQLEWTDDGLIFDRRRERRGWLLPNAAGLSGPSDLIQAPTDAAASKASLTIAGHTVRLQAQAQTGDVPHLALLPKEQLPDGVATGAWKERPAEAPEDLFLVTDLEHSPLFIAAARCRSESGVWIIDPTIPISSDWHGAAAVSADDGAVVGRLLCVEDSRRIVSTSSLGSPSE